MSQIILQSNSRPLPPLPQVDVKIRPATIVDLPFIDGLQKKNTNMVGWMPTKQLESKVKAGQVLVAAEALNDQCPSPNDQQMTKHQCLMTKDQSPIQSQIGNRKSKMMPVGYLIGHDQYFKRDDVGIIYQINIAEGRRRSLVGATLLKAQFERSAYGCKLYCCWCAQDIAANYFWESMGFVPLAFRAGSESRARVHIFWQKRIRAGDVSTPWWFPSKTAGGSIREDRIVLPIPIGAHWSDPMPQILPVASEAPKQLCDPKRERVKNTRIVESPAPRRGNG